MAIRNIKLEKDDILRKKSRIVEKYDEKIKQLIEDMFSNCNSLPSDTLVYPSIS